MSHAGYLETFKQVVNKLNKNKSSPLPLFFSNVDAMDPISKNKQLLRGVFKVFDSRGFGNFYSTQPRLTPANSTPPALLSPRVPMRPTLRPSWIFSDSKPLDASTVMNSFSFSTPSTGRYRRYWSCGAERGLWKSIRALTSKTSISSWTLSSMRRNMK